MGSGSAPRRRMLHRQDRSADGRMQLPIPGRREPVGTVPEGGSPPLTKGGKSPPPLEVPLRQRPLDPLLTLQEPVQDPRHDQGQDPVPLRRGPRVDPPVQSQLLQGSRHGGDMAMGKGADEVEGIVEAPHCRPTLEQGAPSLDQRGRPPGEVGERALLDLPGFAIGLAEQEGRRGGAVGDRFDLQGYRMWTLAASMSSSICKITWVHCDTQKIRQSMQHQ